MFSKNFFMVMIAVLLGGCAYEGCNKGCSCPGVGQKESHLKKHVDKDSIGYYRESDQYRISNQLNNRLSK